MNLRPKKYCAALALGLALVLAGCSGLPTLPGLGGDSKPQSISRPAVESGELQFTHPAAGGHHCRVRYLSGRVQGRAVPRRSPAGL